jgi:hypothetical protein
MSRIGFEKSRCFVFKKLLYVIGDMSRVGFEKSQVILYSRNLLKIVDNFLMCLFH